jgi:ribosomal protein S24E
MSSGFFSDKEVKNKAADTPWKKSERDHVLDVYFAGGEGANPDVIARKIGRNPKAVKRLLEMFVYDERERATLYEPKKRINRKGLGITKNEQALIDAHKERKVDPKITAKVLCRSVAEVTGKIDADLRKSKEQRRVFDSGLDLIWAHRYLYFVLQKPILDDQSYNALVIEEVEYGGKLREFEQIKAATEWPDYIRSLAWYLYDKEKGPGKSLPWRDKK